MGKMIEAKQVRKANAGIFMFFILSGLVSGCGFKHEKGDLASFGPAPKGGQLIEPTVNPSAPPATFAEVDSQIIQPKCIRCHGAHDRVDLSSYEAISLNTKILVPGDPESSKLYKEVHTGKMPRKSLPLTPEQVGMIYTWIKNGAQNDGQNDSPPETGAETAPSGP